jgi:hypothetical protein
MALAKLLSNPVGPLKTLLDRACWGAKDAASLVDGPARSDSARPIGVRHRKAGWVVEAVALVLADRDEPMRAKEVHAAVEALLGEPVRWTSVKSALARDSSRFERVARGCYRLLPR